MTNENSKTNKTSKNELSKTPRLSLESLEDMREETSPLRWLADEIMVAGQPMVIGGPPKSLKTSLMLDLAVSLGSGTPFLNQFKVRKARRVAVFSGESGRVTIKETIGRIIESKDISEAECMLHCGFRLPRLAVPSDRKELRVLLKEEGIEVLVVDPLYLCLFAGRKSLSPANLYDVGSALSASAEVCERAKTTLVLVHHTVKSSASKPVATTLTDLSFAGVAEFARQWLLISRRLEYRPGTGRHELLLSVGGSAGHSSQWGLQIDEGSTGANQRKWSVQVKKHEPAHDTGGTSKMFGIAGNGEY